MVLMGSMREPDDDLQAGDGQSSVEGEARPVAVAPEPPSRALRDANPADLASLHLEWLASRGDLVARAREAYADGKASRAELNGRLDAVDRLMLILTSGAAASVAETPTPAPADELPVVSQDDSIPRHDTVVMDTSAIRNAIAMDPAMAEAARWLESEGERHDTAHELLADDGELLDPDVELGDLSDFIGIDEDEQVDLTASLDDDLVFETLEPETIDMELLVEELAQAPVTEPSIAKSEEEPAEEPVEEPQSDEQTSEWPREVELLYEDVHWLFQLGDVDGALISLERLLVLAPDNEEIQAFVALNEKKLLELYHTVLGDWDRVPRVLEDRAKEPIATNTSEKMRRVLRHVDGQRTIRQILNGTSLNQLEACSALSQLMRARVVVAEEASVAERGA